MDNKNGLIAFILILLVWFGYSIFFPAPAPQTGDPAGSSGTEVRSEDRGSDAATESAKPAAQQTLTVPEGPVGGEQEILVETEHYRAVFTNIGARLKRIELKGYRVDPSADAPPVVVLDAGDLEQSTLRSRGLDGLAFSSNIGYQIDPADGKITLKGQESRKLTFAVQLGNGLVVNKTFTFVGDRYGIGVTLGLQNRGEQPIEGQVELSLVQPWDDSMEGSPYDFVGPATLAGEDLHTDDIDDLSEEVRTYSQELVWTGFEKKYFMTALVPLDNSGEKVVVTREGEAVVNQVVTPRKSLAPGEAVNFDYFTYFGPKDIDLLKAADHRLNEAIDFGFFAPIARPLLTVLKFFYAYIGNYGVAIILLTAIIKLLFWPLTQKSYTSMKAMQKLQPEMQKLRERFKNDRERLNREIMEMYKKHRVNPMGGCLPMLIQIPVFFALYKVLLGSIELRHAPFALWITDLSAKDPYYITPIIMGVTMFLQQKMTPSTMDPAQAKIFLMMPVIFTFLFLNFPSGLVLYWLVNNVLTIGQQAMINRKA